MSLIVLSNTSFNESEENQPRVGGIKTPYSFTNTLQTPLVIPPDSEVALQSIKLNLDGDFEVRNWNDTMYQYIGKRVDEDVAGYLDSINESTRYPAKLTVERGTYNAESFVDKLKVAMNKAIYHPNFQGLANASVQRSASNASFDGYNLKYDRSETASGNNRPGDNDVIAATIESQGWSYDGTTNFRFTKTSASNTVDGRAFVQFTNAPMDLADGVLEVDFGNATRWHVGLSRYCNPSPDLGVDQYGTEYDRDFEEPEYFDGSGYFGFYDYLAAAFYDNASAVHRLRLFHAVKSDDNENPQLELQEVRYYGFTGATFAEPYNLTLNASGFSRIHFETSGEAVKVKLSVAGANASVVTYPTLGTPDGKNNYFKPIAQTCSYLYPKMEIKENASFNSSGEYLQFAEYKCKNDLTGFDYDGVDRSKSNQLPLRDRLINFDWFATQINIGVGGIARLKEVDFRVFNDMSAGTAAHTFIETQNKKISQEYAPVPIVGQSARYIPSDFANMRYVLGFDANVKDQPTSKSGSAVTFTSDGTPQTISNQSVFIRLTSLTQRSVNGVTGNESKIIYHCPRFDNAGNQVGGLFFEPGEKTYLDIGNIAETPINTFSVDLVDNKERFIKSAIGSTTVCLHIRPKKKN